MNIPQFNIELNQLILPAITLSVAFAGYCLTRFVFVPVTHRIMERTSPVWNADLKLRRCLAKFSWLVPFLIIFLFIPEFPKAQREMIERLVGLVLALLSVNALNSLLQAATDHYEKEPATRQIPVKAFAQVVRLLLFAIGAIVIAGIAMDRSPVVLLSGLGALTAMAMVVFKDTLAGFMAGVQIATNHLVAAGDWIEIPGFQSDGVVEEINLHILRIRNWDKSVTTIPLSRFISEPFKNYTGMYEAGMRRVQKSILVDVQSVVADPDNSGHTNLTAYREYMQKYMNENEDLVAGENRLVRLGQVSEKGVAVEFLAFCRHVDLNTYEAVQGRLVETALASLAKFGLTAYKF